MSETETIAAMEAELARDRADLEQAIRRKEQLPGNISHSGFRLVWIGIDLRIEIHMLSDRIFRNNGRLFNAKRRCESERKSGGNDNVAIRKES
jgi:hypothetical protein